MEARLKSLAQGKYSYGGQGRKVEVNIGRAEEFWKAVMILGRAEKEGGGEYLGEQKQQEIRLGLLFRYSMYSLLLREYIQHVCRAAY